jgi:hypothetical protein
MKAAYIDRGAPKSYKPRSPTIRRFAGPECGGGAVDVAAASVNGANWRVRAGQYGQATFPLVLGLGRMLARRLQLALEAHARLPALGRVGEVPAAGVVHRRCAAPPGRRSFQALQRFLARGRSSGNVLATAQRLLCFVQRPPQPRNLHRRKLPQRFPYPQACGSETAATPPNGHVRQERATEAYRPEAPLRQSALLRVPLSRRQQRAEEADFRPEAPLQHSALPRVIWQSRPRYRSAADADAVFRSLQAKFPTSLAGANRSCAAPIWVPRGSITAPRSAPSCQ